MAIAAFIDGGRSELAERLLRVELAQDPGSFLGQALLAMSLVRNRPGEAEAAARRSIALQPGQAFGHYALAWVLYTQSRYIEAAGSAREAAGLDPANPWMHARLGDALVAQHRWSEALDTADSGLVFDPSHVPCLNLRAVSLRGLNRHEEAEECIRVALALQPEDAVTHANSGWTALAMGRSTEAVREFTEARRLDPTLPSAHTGIQTARSIRVGWFFLFLFGIGILVVATVFIGGWIGPASGAGVLSLGALAAVLMCKRYRRCN